MRPRLSMPLTALILCGGGSRGGAAHDNQSKHILSGIEGDPSNAFYVERERGHDRNKLADMWKRCYSKASAYYTCPMAMRTGALHLHLHLHLHLLLTMVAGSKS